MAVDDWIPASKQAGIATANSLATLLSKAGEDAAKNIQAQRDREAAMARQQAAEQAIRERRANELQQMKALSKDPAFAKRSIDLGDISVGAPGGNQLSLALTPAQEMAEKEAGKTLTNYDLGGGKAGMEAGIQALGEVQQDLDKGGKRDNYDRIMGGMFANTFLGGLITPSEKARRDKVASVVASSIKQMGDPNPTAQQINDIMSRTYDPSQTNEQNLEKVTAYLNQKKADMAEKEAAKERLLRTGYASLGVGSVPSTEIAKSIPPSGPMPAQQDLHRQVIKQLRNKNTGKIKLVYNDGTEEIK